MDIRHRNLAMVAVVVGCAVESSIGSSIRIDRVTAQNLIPPGGDGSAITALNSPFTNSDGKVGFTGNLASGERFVWFDNAVIWLNAAGLPTVLSGTETTCGISNSGGFIYSPSADGQDAVWTSNGLLLKATQAAPGLVGLFNSFNSRPNMLPDGTAVWVAGWANTAGGASQGRILYKCPDTANPASTAIVLKSGDAVGGFTIGASGIAFSYDFSDNGLHYIQDLIMTGVPTTADEFIYVDGALPAREGDPTGQGANWQAFTGLSINNSGNYAIGGDDSGVAASDAFVAYNGGIVAREGATLDGYTLVSGSAVRWVSINNLNRVAHIWESGTGASLAGALFVGDGATLGASSRKWLQIGDQIDFTGDNVPDATVTDFEASPGIAPGLSFSDQNFVYVEVSVIDIGQTVAYEAMLRVHQPCFADTAGNNHAVDIDDLLAVINGWNGCGGGCPPHCAADVTHDCLVDIDDLLAVINGWGACP